MNPVLEIKIEAFEMYLYRQILCIHKTKKIHIMEVIEPDILDTSCAAKNMNFRNKSSKEKCRKKGLSVGPELMAQGHQGVCLSKFFA